MWNLCIHPWFSMFYRNFPISLIKLSTIRSLHAKRPFYTNARIKNYNPKLRMDNLSFWNSLGFKIMLRIKKDINS